MPLNAKGEKILSAMKSQYGPEKGEEVFYASKNAGSITGVDSAPTRDQAPMTPSSYVPERQNLIGNVPTEEGGYRNDRKSGEALAPTVAPQTGTIGNTIAGSVLEPKDQAIVPKVGDSSIPMGDESGDEDEIGDASPTDLVESAGSVVNKVANVGESFSKDEGMMSGGVQPSAGMSQSSTSPTPSMDRKLRVGDSNPVGDQSLRNWNQRNRDYWKR